VAVIGISGMMAAVSYARLYGFMFLGRSRSHAVANPKRIRRMTFAPMAVLAFMCIMMGLFATRAVGFIENSLRSFLSLPPSGEYIEQVMGMVDIPILTAALVCIVAAICLLAKIRKKNVVRSETWDCGTDLESNMQYSSVGFTGPLVKVFHPLYGDIVEIVDDEEEEKSKRFSIRYTEPFVRYLYVPLGRSVMRISRMMSRMQNGNVQTYLGYILLTLVILLLIVGAVC
jgi:hydrogenase-4 component B